MFDESPENLESPQKEAEQQSAEQELLDIVRLGMVPGIGPMTRRLLLAQFWTADQIFAADATALQAVQGVGPKLTRAIVDANTNSKSIERAQQEIASCRELGVQLLRPADTNYPDMLAEVCDPPEPLYCRGEIVESDRLAIGIVGSRRCTLYGQQQAERLAIGLANAGITIISGLARGIDGIAHRAALKAGGRTIAVMATGLSQVYPPEHADLAEEIVQNGAIVSESPLAQPPLPGLFPQRNRVISGMSLGVVIVEAARKSGALHTARHAMEQGREVFALPGRIDSPASEGCHDLLRDGVTLVRNVDDILDELGPLIKPVQRADGDAIHVPRELNLNEQERQVLNLLTNEPQHLDELLRGSELGASQTLSTITVLEMKRLAQRLPGGYLVRMAR